MIVRVGLLVCFSAGVIYGQSNKKSLSIGFGNTSIENKTILYSIGQSSLIGSYNFDKKNVLTGFLSSFFNSEKQESISDLVVFPNPSSNYFNLKYNHPGNPSIMLFDLNGQNLEITVRKKNEREYMITNLEYLPAAEYILISENNGVQDFQILILEK